MSTEKKEDEDIYHKARNLSFHFYSSIRGVGMAVPNVYKSYIETDASGGTSVFRMAPHFQECHTIQLEENIKKELKENYTGDKVKWYSNSGSSLGALSNICSNLKNKAIFYLNYNNYSPNHDCLIQNYVKSIVSRSEEDSIIIIDSFGLINSCITVKEDENESDILREQIKESCGERLSNDYDVGSKSNGRYRVVFHLDKMIEK